MLSMKRLLGAWLAMAALSASATGLESLEAFIKTARSGRADFVQVVTAPAKDAEAPRSKTSSGSFEFSRPNRFKFIYRKPFEQSIVADGQTLWLYDVDLNQVTARKQSQVLASTPAALIASAPELRALQTDFALTDAPARDGIEWVLATPRARDSALQNIRVGLRGGELAVLEILDSFGQRSVLTFTHFELNPVLPVKAFEFRAPAGADVIRQ
jgi:outer membrane lipoprotein carrier protein